jgi:nitrogen fixation/metabolism regulation signal transduction histidine kinase
LVAMVTLLYEQITRTLLSPGSGIALGDSPFSAQIKAALILAVAIYVTGVLALGIFTAHRLAGPYLALIRTFREIKEGNFSARLHFRTHDDLAEVESGFNEMMDVLEAEVHGQEERLPLLRVVGE